MITDEKMSLLEACADGHMDCEGKLKWHRIMNDGHEDEWSANYLISAMEPVAYIGAEHECDDMGSYLVELGVTPKTAEEMVHKAYEEARVKGAEHGITAPKLNANMWDCYWCLAMCIADYWMTHMGDLETAAMLAYQYLSDPDR